MNKKLVVLAVAGAFASPLAVQAQTANVTLYGRANIDLEFVNGKTCQNGSTGGGGGGGWRSQSVFEPVQRCGDRRYQQSDREPCQQQLVAFRDARYREPGRLA